MEKVKAVISSKNMHNKKEDAKKPIEWVRSCSHVQVSYKSIGASFTH